MLLVWVRKSHETGDFVFWIPSFVVKNRSGNDPDAGSASVSCHHPTCNLNTGWKHPNVIQWCRRVILVRRLFRSSVSPPRCSSHRLVCMSEDFLTTCRYFAEWVLNRTFYQQLHTEAAADGLYLRLAGFLRGRFCSQQHSAASKIDSVPTVRQQRESFCHSGLMSDAERRNDSLTAGGKALSSWGGGLPVLTWSQQGGQQVKRVRAGQARGH